LAASAWSFTWWNQGIAPIDPRFEAWKPSMIPTRFAGMPISVKVRTASRKRLRSVRLPANGPCRWISLPLK
jgi:hypothetical protein